MCSNCPRCKRQSTSDVEKCLKLICDSGPNAAKVHSFTVNLLNYICHSNWIVDLDCSNSGQFQTLGRRGRRSVDQSFPEANPQHPLHAHHAALLETSNDGDFLNNSIVQDRSSGRPSLHVIDDDRHIETEQQDERIEGLEATVAKMQRTLKVVVHFRSTSISNSDWNRVI